MQILRRLRDCDSPHRTVSIPILLRQASPFGKNEFRMEYIRQLLPRFRLDIRPTWRTRKEGSEYEGIDYRLFPCCVNHMNLSISSKFATYYLTTMT